MIQSIKLDFYKMKFKNIVNKTLDFVINRLKELIGLILIIAGCIIVNTMNDIK